MLKFFAHILTLIMLLIGLAACRYTSPAPTKMTATEVIIAPEAVPLSTIPPGVDGDEIKGSAPEVLEALHQIAQEHPGLSFGISGTYAEQVAGTYDAFRVDENTPFVGQFRLWNAWLEGHEFALTCLVDQVQTPCVPDGPLIQLITLEASEEFLLPIEIHGLTRGLHDFSVTFWQDPYADADDPEADSRVFDADTYRARVSLLVGGDPTPPIITFDEPNGQLSHGFTWICVSQKRDPRDEYGGFPMITHLETSANELFDFYLHLNNKEDTSINFAVTAFLDYQQVPIYQDNVSHTPLYVHIPATTWQPIAVQVQAPAEPGSYEFIIVGTLFPLARLDVGNGSDALINNAYSSTRILLEVQ